MGTRIRRALWGAVLWGIVGFLGACQGLPPEPTVSAPTPTASLTAGPRATNTLFLPETWTPIPSLTPQPTVTTAPTRTPPPPTATIDPAAGVTPVIEPNPTRGTDITLTQVQINAGMTKRFNIAPLSGHASPPHAELGFGFLNLNFSLIPFGAAVGTSPINARLMLHLNVPGGFLETEAMEFAPLSPNISTRLAKTGETLFRDTLEALTREALGLTDQPIFFADLRIRQGEITLTVIRVGE